MIEKRRRPRLAFVLSLLMPGLGHLYAGSPLKALRSWVIIFGLLVLGKCTLLGWIWGLVLLLALAIGAQIYIAVDAWRLAKNTGTIALSWYQRFLVYVFVYVALALLTFYVLFPNINLFTRYNAYRISSGSMESTMIVGDQIIVDMWHFRFSKPQRGDVIVYGFPEDPTRDMVHRCVAIAGDTIEIRDKQLIVNGEPIQEDYVSFKDPNTYEKLAPRRFGLRDQMEPGIVPENCCFSLGDNRDNSLDSRFWGPLPYDLLRGKAKYIYWSRDLSRVGKKIE